MGRFQREWDQVVASMGYGSRDTVRDRVASPDPHAPRTSRSAERQEVLLRARNQHLIEAETATSDADARRMGNSPEQVIARRNVIAAYVGEQNLGSHLGGHDLAQPLFTGPLPSLRPDSLMQAQLSNARTPGEYFALQGFTPDEMGINARGQRYGAPPTEAPIPKQIFPVTHGADEPYLQSVNNPTSDTWSDRPRPVWTSGGAVQVVLSKQRRSAGVDWMRPNNGESDDN
jgi:Bacterial toxin 46